MQIPLIGLTTYNQENKYGFPIAALMHKYISAVADAGGAPMLIPSGMNSDALKIVFDRLDGLLFTGGGDLAPSTYTGNIHPNLDGVDEARDSLEFSLVMAAVETGKPFLGICRGLQTINVAMGGTLYSHIPDEYPNAIKHNYDSGTERELLAHKVDITAGTLLAEVFCETNLSVNSLHHQGVKDLAPRLKPVGVAPDGLVEAVELPGHPFGVAVQWHPEWLTSQPAAQHLFRALIEAGGL